MRSGLYKWESIRSRGDLSVELSVQPRNYGEKPYFVGLRRLGEGDNSIKVSTARENRENPVQLG
jgi:hypothetical protein